MISFCKMKLTFFTRSEKLAKHTMGQKRFTHLGPLHFDRVIVLLD